MLVLGLVATLLLWTVVVAAFYAFTLLMFWLTGRLLPLTGRRKRR